MAEAEEIYFDAPDFFDLDESCHIASSMITKLSGNYVTFSPDGTTVHGYNWGGLRNAVVAYPGAELAFNRLLSTSITNQTSSVDDMASKIAYFLIKTFALRENNTAVADGLSAHIKSAFTDMKETRRSGLFKSYRNEGHGSSWEYRVVFGIPMRGKTDWFYAVVSTIKLTGDIVDMKGWFGLTSETKHNYTADITTMKLLVNKDYVYTPISTKQ